METPSDNVAFSIGGLDIYCYAIMITLGLLLAFALVTYLLKKRGIAVTLRQKKGDDIDAACGQLRADYEG